MFGDEALDPREKKALVFTDSVQDAAHRAGFVESRSHTLTLRALLRHAVGDQPVSLDVLVDRAIAEAGDDQFRRYRIIPPDLVERNEFAPFWQRDRARDIPARVRTRVRRRLLFDAVLEFGLQSRVGRTLEQTGSAVVEVDAGEPAALARMAREVLDATDVPDTLDNDLDNLADSRLVAWVRGVVERMRTQGAIEHEWFQSFIRHDGNRYFIWGGRPRGQGMPAFPRGRAAPAFPRIGPAAKGKDPLLDPVSSPQSWYARWTPRVLGVTGRPRRPAGPATAGAAGPRRCPAHGGHRGRRHGIHHSGERGRRQPDLAGRAGRRGQPAHLQRLPDGPAGHRHGRRPARRRTMPARAAAPARCTAGRRTDNYYRRLYASTDMRRIVAREHTSLVPDETRLRYESEFKQSVSDPNAPNVLVATPTLEMGIDIGDLSAVLLASLPRTVASYLQRVGRAGRLTGSALDLAFVTRPRRAACPPRGPAVGHQRPGPRARDLPVAPRRSCGGSTSPTSSTASPARRTGRTPAGPGPRSGPPTRGRFLGELIRLAEEGAAGHLDRFLA